MKIWLNEKEKYIDVNFWSLLKANVLTSLALIGLVWGSIFALAFIFIIMGG